MWLLAVGSGKTQAQERRPGPALAIPVEPPVFGYAIEPAFGSLRFTDPVALATPPGETNRLFVAEQRGRLAVIPDLRLPERRVFLDLSSRVAGGTPTDERGLLGFAFHPGYATNRLFFVFYSANTNGALHQRISRFEADPADPDRALPVSEVILISQRDEAGNHNGGDLHFGPDGYLYVSLGDEGNQNDSLNNSQRIDRDFFSGILRLDVDRRPENPSPNPHPSVFPGTYAVPADNPWVGASSFNGREVNPAAVRTEFWAVGLRNPWRMSFDSETGQLWAGDVGGGLREEINLIVRGGNYGWAYREGTLAGPKSGQAPAGFASVAPVAQYSHGSGPMQGRSVTGGLVYRGDRMSQLTGAYVFADYVSGNLWAVRSSGGAVTPMERLTGRPGVAGFGRDPRQGDVLLADQANDLIARLVYSTNTVGAPLPPTLSDTGAFADAASLEPAAGWVPYQINVPFWSDGADKRRWFAVPDTNQMIGFRREEPWAFPTGMIWMKHFELELVRGDPSTKRRLETRFLVRHANGVHGLTYRWTDPPTNAVLVPEEGLDETLVVEAGGILRTQVWHFPGRGECLQCHTPAAGWALGFNTRQLNRSVEGDGASVDQIDWLARAGYLDPLPAERHTLPALAASEDETASVEWRVRSWLDANCANCHQPGGSALGAWDARARTPFSRAGLIDGLLNNPYGNPANRLVVPGSVELSMLHTRIRLVGEGRMPPVASSVLDDAAAGLLRRWIEQELPRQPTLAAWQILRFGSTEAPGAAPEADPDFDDAPNWLEYLTGTDPLVAGDGWSLEVERLPGMARLQFLRVANRGFAVEWTDRLADTGSWRDLDAPENRFWLSATNLPTTVEIPFADGPGERFFRVRVFEP